MSDTSEPSDASVIQRRRARAPGVSYAKPVVIHSTPEKITRFRPYSIQHKSGRTEFCLTLEVETPRTQERRDISFDADDVRILYSELAKHDAVMTAPLGGTYITVRVQDGNVSGTTDPKTIFNAAMALLGSPNLVSSLAQNPQAITSAAQSALRISELNAALTEVRTLLDANVNDEVRYQSWIKEHSWVFGAEYMDADVARGITPSDHVDAFLPRAVNGFRELVEIKVPGMQVLNYDERHRNYYFSAHVSRAIGQVDRYLENFARCAAQGLLDHPEIVAHHPVATIVIGRSNEWTMDMHRALRGLNARLSDIDIITFDYLIQRGERLLDIVSRPSSLRDVH